MTGTEATLPVTFCPHEEHPRVQLAAALVLGYVDGAGRLRVPTDLDRLQWWFCRGDEHVSLPLQIDMQGVTVWRR
jgi:hypothetical protein